MRRLEGKVAIITGAASGWVTGTEFTIDGGKTAR
jgi:NADP-dependent 3-hydroxy acid dehydrogenase YdfG